LEQRGIRHTDLEEKDRRRFSEAADPEAGLMAYWRVDRILCQFGFHLSLLPDEIWCEHNPPHSFKRVTKKVRREAVARFINGETTTAVARDYGVSARAVSRWATEAGYKSPPGTRRGNRGTESVFDVEALWEWFKDRRLDLSESGKTWSLRLRNRGTQPLTETVEKYLGELGLTLDDLPKSCFNG
jgi:transposase-like protein